MAADILSYAEGLADAGTDVSMSKWGIQCATLITISTYFFGKTLLGKCDRSSNSAHDLGYEGGIQSEGNLDSKPRAGAVFVMDTAHLWSQHRSHWFSHRRLERLYHANDRTKY